MCTIRHAASLALWLLGASAPTAWSSPRTDVLDKAPGLNEIVFAVRKPGADGHWYANFGYYAPDEKRVAYTKGGWLRKLDLATGKTTDLISDPQGGVRDPVVSHDLTRIVFSWRKGEDRNYHLWECRPDGSGLKQLTDGPWDDIEPCILPDDSLVFVSSRCKRWVNCWLTQVATLHRCDADGGNIRRISDNIEQDNTPWPLPDGRLIYQRWEYVDRSQVHYHHLWTTNPDGTNQINFYGNQKPGLLMIDAKPVPGDQGEVVSIFSPGHGMPEHQGRIAVVNPKLGPDDSAGVRYVTAKNLYRDPWALASGAFIAAKKSALIAVTADGSEETIHTLPQAERDQGYELHEPRPLIRRERERIIPSRIDPTQATGRLILANILEGRHMEGVRPGEIRKLLIMESLPKPINYTGGMDPISYGGSFTLERVVGTVPVESDGSAYLELPAHRDFFFVALDENDLAVKRMQSFVSLQPGQVMSCVGCHEQRTNTTLPAGYLLATARPPSSPEPIKDVPEVFDFPRDIQPVLDKSCAPCHGYEATSAGGPYAGRVILTGDRGPMFSHSYHTLTTRQLFSDGRNRAQSNYAPRTLGSSASRLLKMLDGSHFGAVASPVDQKKLRLWIEAAATYPGTYAALGTGMIGGYVENNQVECDEKWPSTQAGAAVIERRCASCHNNGSGPPPIPKSLSDERGMSFWIPRIPDRSQSTSRHVVFNLSRPEKSLLLLAPLSREAGGFGICQTKDHAPVMTDTADPDYLALLAMVQAGRDALKRLTRFDMPDFKPHPAYLREMKRFGILPVDLPPDARVDPYATDARYWQSLWYLPVSKKP